jgi:uncharacterized UBP type Zn finger protein
MWTKFSNYWTIPSKKSFQPSASKRQDLSKVRRSTINWKNACKNRKKSSETTSKYSFPSILVRITNEIALRCLRVKDFRDLSHVAEAFHSQSGTFSFKVVVFEIRTLFGF